MNDDFTEDQRLLPCKVPKDPIFAQQAKEAFPQGFARRKARIGAQLLGLPSA